MGVWDLQCKKRHGCLAIAEDFSVVRGKENIVVVHKILVNRWGE